MSYAERSAKREEMKAMLGWNVHWSCSRLLTCVHIFSANSDDLLEFLRNPPAIPFKKPFPDKETRLAKIQSDAAVIRLLHNYVASVKTLVEHSRKARNKYLSVQAQSVHDDRVRSEFIENPRAQIVQSLRNYILHVDVPVISNRINLQNGSSRLALVPAKMLLWDNWNAPVRDYLKELEVGNESLMLEDLVSEYTESCQVFSSWLVNELIAGNHDHLEALYKLNDDILQSTQADGFITDPLIVRCFTRGRY